MRAFVMIVGLAVVPFLAVASQDEPRGTAKKKWQWTDEERLAIRFDPSLAAKRAAVQREASVVENAPAWGSISGHRDPELFLPIELFTSLMTGIEGEPAARASYRAGLRGRIVAFGLDDTEFWIELERAAYSHLKLFHRYTGLTEAIRDAELHARKDLENAMERLQPELCESRLNALLKARQQFGAEEFNRFLYSAVAPGLTITAAAPSAATAEHLRFLSRGCR
jgi:hypothetical protein